ncbi:hypothetical protein CAOG_008553 [Capsaspora owczarzaki ATCC 30864]|uniref:Uncharacterized protein n=1 Tax=Capsaspora owczarzaki (strain ATCC 30864) TaxID=595528 RepID=A0A0D2U608_CAPO3|nr:hypothetical protein CAOG_008553 [Capsaspora owczarzaki ATCC 30864]
MDIDLSTNADTNAAADADAADATFDLAAAAAEAVEGLLQSKAKATAALPVGAIPLVLGKPATAFLMETTEPQLNLSGDTGSVGRLVVNAQDAAAPLVLDLKGLIFQGTVVPSNTFMLVTIGPNEARIDATVNNVIHTTCLGDALDSMTVVEGSIDAVS